MENADDTVELMSPKLTQDSWKPRVHGLGGQLLCSTSELTRRLSSAFCPIKRNDILSSLVPVMV